VDTVTIDWLGKTATYHYDEAGRVTGLDQFNGTGVSFGYDDANRLISLENRKSGGEAIATYGFVNKKVKLYQFPELKSVPPDL
jgi:YD repeat-containing protein